MTQARGFGHARGARRELNIHDVIRMQALILKRIVLSTVFEDMLVPLQTSVFIQDHPSLCVVYQHSIFKRRNEFRFEGRAGEVGYQMCEE
jgi:hypothetical protein